MTINFSCPHCGKHMNVADQFAGQRGPCSGCGQPITIPGGFGGLPKPGMQPARSSGGSGAIIAIVLGVLLVGALLVVGIAAMLVLPAFSAAGGAARRSQSLNNAKQITLAMHNYHDTFRVFPPVVVNDENGNPLYSGRVLLLPFLEHHSLYERWDKTKAWDSPENLPLAQSALQVFQDPAAESGTPGRTDYLFVTGQGTIFEGAQSGTMSNVTDGTSNTMYLVEVKDTGVSWAEPRDIDIGQIQNGLPPGNHRKGNAVGMLDGSVRFVPDDTPPSTIQAMATRAGGEMVELPY